MTKSDWKAKKRKSKPKSRTSAVASRATAVATFAKEHPLAFAAIVREAIKGTPYDLGGTVSHLYVVTMNNYPDSVYFDKAEAERVRAEWDSPEDGIYVFVRACPIGALSVSGKTIINQRRDERRRREEAARIRGLDRR